MGNTDISKHHPRPPLKRRGHLWWSLGAGLVLAFGIGWLTRLSWLPLLGTSLEVSDPLRHASAVLILPGSENTRPFVAAGLIKAGYADLALVPETRANPDVHEGSELSTSELTRQILLRRGIPERKIVTLEGSSDSTIGDAMALNRYFQQFGESDIIIVTNAYHSRRAQWTFRHVLPEHQTRLRFYSGPNEFDVRRWWTSRKGCRVVLSEWLKFAFYLTYHGHGWLWCVVSATVGGTLVFSRRFIQGSENVGIRASEQPDTGSGGTRI